MLALGEEEPQAVQGQVVRVAGPQRQEDRVDARGGGEAPPPCEALPDAVAHDRPHRGPNGLPVPRALREVARPGTGPRRDGRERSEEAEARRDRPAPRDQARPRRRHRHGRGREGDVVGGARQVSQHARQEGEAKGPGEAARRGSAARGLAEAAGVEGSGHLHDEEVQAEERVGLRRGDPLGGGPASWLPRRGRGRDAEGHARSLEHDLAGRGEQEPPGGGGPAAKGR
mmetsp:Transcript_3470/g.10071  ORF Transcript_3470/g.10071 Transcript_3470/m.10071 type:complete len:228 (-) Transcript_3470:1619-2302(-)